MSSSVSTSQRILPNLDKVKPPSYHEATVNSSVDVRFQSLESRFNQILNNIESLLPSNTSHKQPLPGTLTPSIPSYPTSSTATNCPASNDATVRTYTTSLSTSFITTSTSNDPNPASISIPERKRQYLKRLFSPMDAASSSKSYTYVYLPHSRPMNRQKVRSIFRGLSIDNLRILDITFPAKDTIGVLLHEAYLPEFESKFLEIGISPLSDFDPLDSKHIADPKHQHLPKEDRIRLAQSLQQQRCIQTLNFVRPNLVCGIAKYFINQRWISDPIAKNIITKRVPNPPKWFTTPLPPDTPAS